MSPRKLRKQVYVSSTFSDLEQHRAHLKHALEKAGYDVECMERYPAFDTRPADKCLTDVAACDVYVVLVALRYGHIPADNNPAGKSITEMEYDKAVETTRPKLAFMLDIDDEDFGWPPKRGDKDWQDANSNIARFRERVGKELGRALFTTPENLATAVLQALRQQEITEMPAGERDQAQIREAYLDWLRRECDSVELLGLDLKESRNLGLGHVYVPAVTNAATARASTWTKAPSCCSTTWGAARSTCPARRARASPPSAAGWPWRSSRGGFLRTGRSLSMKRTSPRHCRIPSPGACRC